MSREQDTVAPAIDRDTAETGRMRLRGVVDEAWRDIVSGTSHAFMLMLILAALVGGLSAADLFSIRSIAQQVDRYIASGASTYVIEFKGGISGEACERLSSVDGVLASGALRSKNDKVTSAVLPSAGIPSLDATTGALGVFASSTRSDGATLTVRDYDGIWLRRPPGLCTLGRGTGSHCVPAARCASPGCSNTRMTADQPATTMWRLARFPQLQTISTNAWSRPGRCLTPCSHCSNPRYPRGHRTPRSSLQSASSTARKARSSMPSRHSGGGKARSLPL